MGPLKPVIVWHNSHLSYHAEHVLALAQQDAGSNVWFFGNKKIGDGFIMKVDTCKRWVVGVQIQNKGKEKGRTPIGTKQFRVHGSVAENGPWDTVLESELEDETQKQAILQNFTFNEPFEIQYLKFEVVSFWGSWGAGLQYFAATPAPSAAESKDKLSERK